VPLLPDRGPAVATADRHGTFNGTGTVRVGGGPGLTQTVTGTEQLNSDCTGTITYHQTINTNRDQYQLRRLSGRGQDSGNCYGRGRRLFLRIDPSVEIEGGSTLRRTVKRVSRAGSKKIKGDFPATPEQPECPVFASLARDEDYG
jgi:hypothetical protein